MSAADSYVEALPSKVTVFGDGGEVFAGVMKLKGGH